MIVDKTLKLPFTFSDKLEITNFGADRIIDITQAVIEYPDRNLIIFDLGTATT